VKALRHKKSAGEYLAYLSVKHEVDPSKFFSALRQAFFEKTAECEHLHVECRGKNQTNCILSIRNKSQVLAQFKVTSDFLLSDENSLSRFMETEKIRKLILRRTSTVQSHFIKDLRSGMTHVNLRARILHVAEPRRVITRYGNYANVAKALIEDETGTISLCLWNEQIRSVSVGDTVQIGNARASTFRGERQLTLGTRSVINSAETKLPLIASTFHT
jgi:hypothetical protein